MGELETSFEYQVEKDGDIYIAGARDCKFFMGKAIWGNLLLDKLVKKNSRTWSPRLTNPLATETRTEEVRQSGLYIPLIMIAHHEWRGESEYSLNKFVESIEEEILQEYGKRRPKISKIDLTQFFEKTHNRYMNYF